KDFLGGYEARRAKLRTFLRVCVDRFVANQEKAGRRLKRGGEVQFVALEFEAADGELKQIEIPAPGQMDEFFDREWARSVFALSLERLRKEMEESGKQTHFQLLELYDVEDGGRDLTYGQVGSAIWAEEIGCHELPCLCASLIPA